MDFIYLKYIKQFVQNQLVGSKKRNGYIFKTIIVYL